MMNCKSIKIRFMDWFTRRRTCGPIKSLIGGLIIGLVVWGVSFLMYGWELKMFLFLAIWGPVAALFGWAYMEFFIPWQMRMWSRRYDKKEKARQTTKK